MRQRNIQLRLDDKEIEILKKASSQDHIPLSAWIRMVALRIGKDYLVDHKEDTQNDN